MLMKKKDTRISVRISKEEKKLFYSICEIHGLCPSILIYRWIHRFNSNAKRSNVQFSSIVKSVHDEMYLDYNEYIEPKIKK